MVKEETKMIVLCVFVFAFIAGAAWFALTCDLWLLATICIVSLIPVVMAMRWWWEDHNAIKYKRRE